MTKLESFEDIISVPERWNRGRGNISYVSGRGWGYLLSHQMFSGGLCEGRMSPYSNHASIPHQVCVRETLFLGFIYPVSDPFCQSTPPRRKPTSPPGSLILYRCNHTNIQHQFIHRDCVQKTYFL